MFDVKRVPINKDNISITRDISKCISCGTCKSVCKYSSCVYEKYEIKKEPVCINCGQCTLVCPTNSLHEVYDYIKLKKQMKQKNKVFVFQTAPAVRVALGEEFGLDAGSFIERKMIKALRILGADYVFDTTFGADLTILEEASELLKRVKNNKLPLFTSCCPAWVEYVEIFKPELIPNLSTTKSPIGIQGAIIKDYFCSINNIKKENIVSIALTPCTAKKEEIKRNNDIDYVITTREFAIWLKEENIDLNSLEDSSYDNIMDKGSGAGLIFGATGGVSEAILRTLNYIVTGKNKEEFLDFKPVRGLNGIKEASFTLLGKPFKIASVSQIKNVRKLFDKLDEYAFIEVMACRGGCIAGGGQPKTTIPLDDDVRLKRINSLYKNDSDLKIRYSYENINVINLYKNYLDYPMSSKAIKLLHTKFIDESYKIK